MIYVVMLGRLGNQMFQYAFAKNIAFELDDQVILVKFKEKNRLANFHLDKNTRSARFSENRNVTSIIKKYENRCTTSNKSNFDKNFEFRYKNWRVLTDRSNSVWEFINEKRPIEYKKSENLILYGYFQSEKFFYQIKDSVDIFFAPKRISNNVLKVRNDIANNKYICVHIRLGDYLNNPYFHVCTKEYYIKAIEYMNDRYPDDKFLIFSDNINIVKSDFELDEYNVEYMEYCYKDYAILYCMSACKHFIISNSSYSWWAQYLSGNNKKTVIAPDRWDSEDTIFGRRIYMSNWTIIESK